VQIWFDKRARPSFGLYFARLPPICKRWKDDKYVDVPREQAIVFEGPACFSLCKNRKDVCQFGYYGFRLFPQRHLDAEIERLLELLPELFDLFERGFPQEWFVPRRPGQLTDHVFLADSRKDAFPLVDS
jgi:hypothetical protein